MQDYQRQRLFDYDRLEQPQKQYWNQITLNRTIQAAEISVRATNILLNNFTNIQELLEIRE